MIFKSALEYLKEHPGKGELIYLDAIKPEVTLPSVPWAQQTQDSDRPYIAAIQDAYLFGNGLLLSRSGVIFEESMTYYPKGIIDRIRAKGTFLEVEQKRQGAYLALNGYWSHTFYHWMFEYLPRVFMAREAGFDGFFVIGPGAGFMRESLEMLGVDPGNILLHDNGNWWVEELYVPASISAYVFGFFPALVDAMRQAYLSRVSTHEAPKSRLYIARRDGPRKIVNEDDLVTVLEKFNFTKIYMEDLSLSAQIETIAAAECLLGPHGAGMAHSLFMRPGSLIVELFAPTYINPCVLSVIDHLQHRYHMVCSYRNPPNSPYEHDQDIVANIEVVEMTLRRELAV